MKQLVEQRYCKSCLKDMFNGALVNPILPFNSPYKEESDLYARHTAKLSISGVQIKYSMRLEGNQLRLTDSGGEYILKPIPSGPLKELDQAPANEHLTMQLARQFFKIEVPANVIVFFNDMTPAYLVRRFDVKPDGLKHQQEDFAQIAQVTADTHGETYKYDLSYEQIGELIKRYIAMYPVEMEKYFRQILFNYVFSNGDAHLKNFSAMLTTAGDYVLAPAYDLLCTRIHSPGESDMALDLFNDDFFSDAFLAHGYYTRTDFEILGERLGIRERRVEKIIMEFHRNTNDISVFISRSLLNEQVKALYNRFYLDKISRLR